MSDKKLIELYSDMSTNHLVDYKTAGELIVLNSKDAIKLIDILIENHVEFTVWDVGECLIDRSYEYWHDYSDLELPKSRKDIEGE